MTATPQKADTHASASAGSPPPGPARDADTAVRTLVRLLAFQSFEEWQIERQKIRLPALLVLAIILLALLAVFLQSGPSLS